LITQGHERKQLQLDVARLNAAAKSSGIGLPFHQLKKWSKQEPRKNAENVVPDEEGM
jgi:hypothetical protein